jgi:hypothetical protein
MQTITTIGLDIAKSVFQVHGVDAAGEVVIRRQLKRRSVLAFFQKLPPFFRKKVRYLPEDLIVTSATVSRVGGQYCSLSKDFNELGATPKEPISADSICSLSGPSTGVLAEAA